MLGTQEVRAATNEAQRISQEGDRMVSTAKAAKATKSDIRKSDFVAFAAFAVKFIFCVRQTSSVLEAATRLYHRPESLMVRFWFRKSV